MKKLLLLFTLALTTTLVIGQTRVGSTKAKSNKKPEQFNSTLVSDGSYSTVELVTDFCCFNEVSKAGDPFAKLMLKAGFVNKISVRELSISPYNLENTKAELKVFNIMGQTMWTGIVSEQDISFDTRNWSGGIYYIQMRSEEGVIQKSVFIK